MECIGKKCEGTGLEGHYGRSQSRDIFEGIFEKSVGAPVISATKKANEMEIVMISRVLGLRLNAMLMEEGSIGYDKNRYRPGRRRECRGRQALVDLTVDCRRGKKYLERTRV